MGRILQVIPVGVWNYFLHDLPSRAFPTLAQPLVPVPAPVVANVARQPATLGPADRAFGTAEQTEKPIKQQFPHYCPLLST